MSVALLRLKKTNLQNMPKHDLLQIGQALQNDNRGQQSFSRNGDGGREATTEVTG